MKLPKIRYYLSCILLFNDTKTLYFLNLLPDYFHQMVQLAFALFLSLRTHAEHVSGW